MIRYREGYKYQLAETYQEIIPLRPAGDIITDFVLLNRDGMLSIMRGYAWDGPSGPMPDTADTMRGSLVHDALYQLFRTEKLPIDLRNDADKLLRQICIEDGMSHPMAELMYQAVRIFGDPYADPANDNPIIEAP